MMIVSSFFATNYTNDHEKINSRKSVAENKKALRVAEGFDA